nr:MAG TPA: hypothetical protein [Bacteriophage sp.]
MYSININSPLRNLLSTSCRSIYVTSLIRLT